MEVGLENAEVVHTEFEDVVHVELEHTKIELERTVDVLGQAKGEL